MSVDWCPSCGGLMFSMLSDRPHQCPPRWLVSEVDSPEGASIVYANSDSEAAIRWAEGWDEEGHIAYKGNAVYCLVECAETGLVAVYRVVGEMRPHYEAKEHTA